MNTKNLNELYNDIIHYLNKKYNYNLQELISGSNSKRNINLFLKEGMEIIDSSKVINKKMIEWFQHLAFKFYKLELDNHQIKELMILGTDRVGSWCFYSTYIPYRYRWRHSVSTKYRKKQKFVKNHSKIKLDKEHKNEIKEEYRTFKKISKDKSKLYNRYIDRYDYVKKEKKFNYFDFEQKDLNDF